MQYLGGKYRLGKHIGKLVQRALDVKGADSRVFYEPFVGACNIIPHLDADEYYCSDLNPYIIALWQALQNGWEPPTSVTPEDHQYAKANMDSLPPEYVAFVGFACSFAGTFFGGYARNRRGDDYAKAGRDGLLRKIEKMGSKFYTIKFSVSDYRCVDYKPESVAYFDPPYRGRRGYKVGAFDSDELWRFTRTLNSRGVVTLTSEYTLDEGYIDVLNRAYVTGVRDKQNKTIPVIERLGVSKDYIHLFTGDLCNI